MRIRTDDSRSDLNPLGTATRFLLAGVFAFCAVGLGGNPRIRGIARGADGRVSLTIEAAGVAGEFLDVFATDRLLPVRWRLVDAYLRPTDTAPIPWSEAADAAPGESRFYRVGRADVDNDENGIPDVRETLTHVHDLPVGTRARWARAGLGGAPTNFATVLNVKLSGAKGNGTTDDTAVIANVIAGAPAGSVVYLPAGTYRLTQPLYLKSDMILRGDGASLTSLVFEGAGTVGRCIGIIRWDGNQPTTYVAVVDGFAFDSTALTLGVSLGLRAGDVVEIEEDNDPAWGFVEDWQQRLPGQILRIVSVDATGRRIVVDRPLRHPYVAQRNPRMRKLTTIANVGIENLFVRRKDAINGYTIEMKHAVRCWVRKVESSMTYKSHVWMDRSYECEVRESFFHESHVYGGGGQGYGVGCGKRTSDCLVENNVLRHLRHSMIVGIGANGNVFGYNYSTLRAIDPVHGTPQPDISVHGNYVYMNLFEGNVLEDADAPDWYWPAGPGNTLFRNRISNSGTAIDVGSDRQNALGNVLTRGTLTQTSGLEGVVDYGNVEKGDATKVEWPGCPCQSLPDSLYRAVPPPFILERASAWPAIGPEQPLDATTPSELRFKSGEFLP